MLNILHFSLLQATQAVIPEFFNSNNHTEFLKWFWSLRVDRCYIKNRQDIVIETLESLKHKALYNELRLYLQNTHITASMCSQAPGCSFGAGWSKEQRVGCSVPRTRCLQLRAELWFIICTCVLWEEENLSFACTAPRAAGSPMHMLTLLFAQIAVAGLGFSGPFPRFPPTPE